MSLDGPAVPLAPAAVQPFAMVLHELATNAAKYGALSVPDGCVRLSWMIEGDDLNFHWHETDGPPVMPPVGKGFGSRLIAMGFGRSSTVEPCYAADGFRLDMRTSLADLAN